MVPGIGSQVVYGSGSDRVSMSAAARCRRAPGRTGTDRTGCRVAGTGGDVDPVAVHGQ